MSRLTYVTVALTSAVVLSLPQFATAAPSGEQRVRSRGGSATSTRSPGTSGRAVRRGSSPRSGDHASKPSSGRAGTVRGGAKVTSKGTATRSGARTTRPTRRVSTPGGSRETAPPKAARPPETASIRRVPRNAPASPTKAAGRRATARGPGRLVEVGETQGSERRARSRAIRVGSSSRGRTGGRVARTGRTTQVVPQPPTSRSRTPRGQSDVVGRAVQRPPLTASPGYSRPANHVRAVGTYGRGGGSGYRTTSSYGYRYGYDGGRTRFARPAPPRYRHVRFPRLFESSGVRFILLFPRLLLQCRSRLRLPEPVWPLRVFRVRLLSIRVCALRRQVRFRIPLHRIRAAQGKAP